MNENTVAIAGRDEAKLNEVVRDNPSLHAHVVDVTDEEQARQTVDDVARELAGLSILVNSAGTITRSDIADADAAALAERDLETNFVGSLRMTRLALPYLREAEDAAIVFLSSGVAHSLRRAMERDSYEVLIGTAGVVALADRVSPGLADQLVARATRSA
jgi:uncharacterized oxidoreductase